MEDHEPKWLDPILSVSHDMIEDGHNYCIHLSVQNGLKQLNAN